MTGSKDFMYKEVSNTNPNYYLKMKLARNKSGCNYLKISLMNDDTYKMEFYKQSFLRKTCEIKVGKQQTFETVYCDQLVSIFERVTGLYTKLF